jgi:ammonia channel protein AmtB
LTAGSVTWFDPETQKTVVYNNGDIAWTLASTALVWIMIPGVGFFYSGLLRRKNALSMIYLSMMTIAVVSFQVSINRFFHYTRMMNLKNIVVLLGIFSDVQRDWQ